MCMSSLMQNMQLGGQILGGFSGLMQSNEKASLAREDASSERDAGRQQAEKILKATARRRGEARAATAASGTRLDSFAMGVERDIEEAGQTDALISVLSSNRKAKSLERGASMNEAAGRDALSSSLLKGAYKIDNWRGRKAPVEDRGSDWYSEDYYK